MFKAPTLWLGLITLCFLHPAYTGLASTTIELAPSDDTTLSENYPDHNFGAHLAVNAGTTQNYTKNRGLFRFDIAGSIPAGSKIISATLILEVTHQPADGFAFADFGLHRALSAWGEGRGDTPSGQATGVGALATTNEASWFYRFAFTTNAWSAPGGAAGTDYVATASSIQTIYGTADSPYSFDASAQMIDDIQLWLDHPATNYGWFLICQTEEDAFTARRFGSREDTNAAPVLEIEYQPPVIDRAEKVGNQFQLQFQAQAGKSYIVEYSDNLANSNAWTVLTNLPAPPTTTNIVVTDSISPSKRFYRFRMQ
jgi:hypothetical protein